MQVLLFGTFCSSPPWKIFDPQLGWIHGCGTLDMEACLYEVFGKTEQEIQISSLTQSMQTWVGKITDDRCFGTYVSDWKVFSKCYGSVMGFKYKAIQSKAICKFTIIGEGEKKWKSIGGKKKENKQKQSHPDLICLSNSSYAGFYIIPIQHTSHKTRTLTQHSASHQDVKECFCISSVIKFCSRSIKKLCYCFQISTSFS